MQNHKENAHTRKLKSKFHCKERVSLGTEMYTKIDQIKICWYDHRFILGHQK